MSLTKEVEAVPFRVHFQNGDVEEFRSTEDTKVIWHVGMAGELNITNNVVNSQFSVVVSENRMRTYNHRVWAWVEVLWDEVRDET